MTTQDTVNSASMRGSFVHRLASIVRDGIDARTVYGEPIERESVTVIPVARVRWMVGGGDGGDAEGNGGGGGGGSISALPIGYIEIKDGETTFKPIVSLPTLIPFILVSSFATLFLLSSLRKLLRVRRR